MHVKNIKNNVLTWLGFLFIIADLFYWIGPMFLKEIDMGETNFLIMIGGALIGLGLILAPDDLYGALKKKIE
jgi:1,4-dihydroxy-2-naphthoate octaprenyltransferase